MSNTDAKLAAANIAIAGGGYTLAAWTLNDFVAVATLIFVVFQTVLLLPKLWELGVRIAVWYRRRKTG